MRFINHTAFHYNFCIVFTIAAILFIIWLRPFDDRVTPSLQKPLQASVVGFFSFGLLLLVFNSYIDVTRRISFEDEILRFKNSEIIVEIDGRDCSESDYLMSLFSNTNPLGHNHGSGTSKHEVFIHNSSHEFGFRLVRNSVVRDDFVIEIREKGHYREVGNVRSQRLVEIVER